jgi:hypothetical protein
MIWPCMYRREKWNGFSGVPIGDKKAKNEAAQIRLGDSDVISAVRKDIIRMHWGYVGLKEIEERGATYR